MRLFNVKILCLLLNIAFTQNVPTIDLSKASVALEDVYFDTFNPVNRSIPLSEASSDLIESLRDAIPPLHEPHYEKASRVSWLESSDMILGYTVGEQAWAYPVRILNYHEIVNDDLAGQPVLISYCPLCFSGIVYSRRLAGKVLTFGNTSALYESDMVMLDYETGSYWWQVAGEAIVGELTGEELGLLPSTMTTWQKWEQLYPNSLVLSRNTGFTRPYERDPFSFYSLAINNNQFAFPVSEAAADSRLQPANKVLTVKLGELVKAYPLDNNLPKIIHDTLNEENIVVFLDSEVQSGNAFLTEVKEHKLSFTFSQEKLVDTKTGSTWNQVGKAIAGELVGTQLQALPSKTSFWFAIVAAEPNVVLYTNP